MKDDRVEALSLAVRNKAVIQGLVGASYPNGQDAHGVNRDVPLDLTVEQSRDVYEFIKKLLGG